MLCFSKPFQVQSQLNTISVNEILVLQEAFKPSQVIVAIQVNLNSRYNYVLALISDPICHKPHGLLVVHNSICENNLLAQDKP